MHRVIKWTGMFGCQHINRVITRYIYLLSDLDLKRSPHPATPFLGPSFWQLWWSLCMLWTRGSVLVPNNKTSHVKLYSQRTVQTLLLFHNYQDTYNISAMYILDVAISMQNPTSIWRPILFGTSLAIWMNLMARREYLLETEQNNRQWCENTSRSLRSFLGPWDTLHLTIYIYQNGPPSL
jgi:hypothetical protein